MLGQSILQSQLNRSPIQGQSTLKPKGFKGKRSLVFTLTLTSLIDAFSILVIYLLVNFSTPTASLRVSGELQLPQASQSQNLGPGSVVSVSAGHYFINDKEIPNEQIVQKLIELRGSLKKKSKASDAGFSAESLVIQADRKVDYASLSPVILAANQAGFHQFKFAVLQGGVKQ